MSLVTLLDCTLEAVAGVVQRGLDRVADGLELLAGWLRDPPGGATA